MSMTHIKEEITTFGCMNGGLYDHSYPPPPHTHPPPSVQTVSGKEEEHRICASFMAIEIRIRKSLLQSRQDWELWKGHVGRQREREDKRRRDIMRHARQGQCCCTNLHFFFLSLNFPYFGPHPQSTFANLCRSVCWTWDQRT